MIGSVLVRDRFPEEDTEMYTGFKRKLRFWNSFKTIWKETICFRSNLCKEEDECPFVYSPQFQVNPKASSRSLSCAKAGSIFCLVKTFSNLYVHFCRHDTVRTATDDQESTYSSASETEGGVHLLPVTLQFYFPFCRWNQLCRGECFWMLLWWMLHRLVPWVHDRRGAQDVLQRFYLVLFGLFRFSTICTVKKESVPAPHWSVWTPVHGLCLVNVLWIAWAKTNFNWPSFYNLNCCFVLYTLHRLT